MISESLQEDGSLYVLGLLDGDDASAYERAMAQDPELRDWTYQTREAAMMLALGAGSTIVQPSASLKSRIFESVSRDAAGKTSNVVAFVPPTARSVSSAKIWLPWAIAALLLGVCGVLMMRENAMRREIAKLDHLAKPPSPEPASLAAISYCSLDPTDESAGKPRAIVLWDSVRQAGMLRVVELKPPGEGKDYQLWAVESGHKNPVSAGIVAVDESGTARYEFKPDAGDHVLAFAISLEQAGGVPERKGPILLLGKL